MGSFGSRGGLRGVVPVKKNPYPPPSEKKIAADLKVAASTTPQPFIDLRKKGG